MSIIWEAETFLVLRDIRVSEVARERNREEAVS
jgi:hypothetical protein